MITTTIDVSAIADLSKRFVTLQQADGLLREVALGMQVQTRERIHEQGRKGDGSQIGQYSDGYLKLREQTGRGSDRKVILSFTGQMENQYKVIALSDTEYALGWEDEFNGKKADWIENGTEPATVKAHTRKINGKSIEVKSYSRKGWSGYGKIYSLTPEELDGVRAIVQDFIQRNFE